MPISPSIIREAHTVTFDLADAAEKARTTAFSSPIISETIKEAVRLNDPNTLLPNKEHSANLATILSDATAAMETFNNIAQLALLFPTRVMKAIARDDEAALRNLIQEADKALNAMRATRRHSLYTVKVDITETIIEVPTSRVPIVDEVADHIKLFSNDVRSANVMGTKHVDTRFKSGDFHLVASIARKEDGITTLSVWGRDGDNQMINLEDNETAKAFIRHLEKLRN